ncbi:Site-specific recombinase XerD [Chitinophaga ginsengisegetis]|uniref:Site-specific recombinase XerD n=2 Tax=Chitinophaga ginsengisegetis TaxID=393003 RepID=A0A1T5PCK6_9BACT|nr:Site-specific recombinase XerD [Chitinophaga ginsengisegetis]
MLTQELPYTLPELYRGPNEWYVHYSYLNPETLKFERFKESWGLNKKKNLAIREKIAQEIIDVITNALKSGFNPIEGIKKPVNPETEIANLQSTSALTHIQGIVNDWAKTESKSANTTYRTMLSRFRKYLNHSNQTYIQIDEVTVDVAESFRDYLMQIKKNGPKTVNTSISHIGLFWDELKKRKLTKENPFRLVKYVTDKDYKGIEIDLDSEEYDFIPLTTEEFEKVLTHFASFKRHYLRFFGMIYWEFMRPVEITRLRVKDIDLKGGLVRISKPDAKNKSAAFIQILAPMATLLHEMELHKYPPDYFLFTGKRLLPGSKQKDPEEARFSWNRVVKEGLGIDKKPYALKHTGNIAYIINNKGNVDREWMQRQNRHKTRAQTDKYIERLNIYTIDETQYNFTQLPTLLESNKKAG